LYGSGIGSGRGGLQQQLNDARIEPDDLADTAGFDPQSARSWSIPVRKSCARSRRSWNELRTRQFDPCRC